MPEYDPKGSKGFDQGNLALAEEASPSLDTSTSPYLDYSDPDRFLEGQREFARQAQDFLDLFNQALPGSPEYNGGIVESPIPGGGGIEPVPGAPILARDASLEAQLAMLDQADGMISGRQMIDTLRDGIGDRDGQSGASELQIISDWASRNGHRLSPQAMIMFNKYLSEVDKAKDAGLPGIRGSRFDAMIVEMDRDLAKMGDIGPSIPVVPGSKPESPPTPVPDAPVQPIPTPTPGNGPEPVTPSQPLQPASPPSPKPIPSPVPDPVPAPEPPLRTSPLSSYEMRNLSTEGRALVEKWQRRELDSSTDARMNALFAHPNFTDPHADQRQMLDSIAAAGVTSVRAQNLFDIYSGQGYAQMSFSERNVLYDLAASGAHLNWFADCSADQQKSIMAGLGHGSHASKQAYMDVIRSDAFTSMSTEDKLASLKALDAVPRSSDRQNFARMFTQTIPKDPNTPIILARDSQGRTTLDHITEVVDAEQLWTPLMTSKKEEALSNLYEVLIDTGKYDQSGKGTCAGTIPGKELAINEPAEFSRLLTGGYLRGQATLRNGDTLQFDQDSINEDHNGTRRIGERMIQVAFMEYANGPNLDYRNAEDGHYDSRGRKDHSGLYAEEKARLMEGIYGTNYSIESRSAARGMPRIEQELAAGRWAQVGIRWSEHRSTRDGETTTIHGYHAVAVTKIQDGYVYFCNPWGRSDSPNGTWETDPPRQIWDQEKGIERMTIEEFKSRFSSTLFRD